MINGTSTSPARGGVLRRALAVVALPMLLGGVITASGAALPTSALAVPLPPQPAIAGMPNRPCAVDSSAAGRWTPLVSQMALTPDTWQAPRYQVAVDPWNPCHLYRAVDSQTVQRSADGGRTWQPAFFDDAQLAPQTPPFNATGMHVVARDSVLLTDNGNGDAVVGSHDGGTTWSLLDGGIEGRRVHALEAAPSDPRVLYALTMATAGRTQAGIDPFSLYVSKDAGGSWTPGSLPEGPLGATVPQNLTERLAQVRVDPAHAAHLWLLIENTVLESDDYGTTFTNAITLPAAATELLVTRSAGGLHLYAVMPSAQNPFQVSSDDGATWTPIAIPPLTHGVVAADPADQGRMLYVGVLGSSAQTYYTVNGFATFQRTTDLVVEGGLTLGVYTPLDDEQYSPDIFHVSTPVSFDPELVLQADRSGDFVLGYLEACPTASCDPSAGAVQTFRQTYARLVPPPRSRTAATPGGDSQPPAPPGSCPIGVYTCVPTQPTPLVQLAQCPLPPAANPDYGTLTFDGVDLLYTEDEYGPRPLQGVIHKLNPSGCSDDGTILVDFTADDLKRAGSSSLVQISTVSFDPTRYGVWFSLDVSGFPTTGLFFARILDTEETHASAVLRTNAPCPGFLLSYDISDDSIWTCDAAHQSTPGHIAAGDLHGIANCQNTRFNSTLATWAIGGVHRLYEQSEDDATISEYDTVTCAVLQTFVHRTFSEPLGENEQLVCESVSFGPHSGAVVPTTVMWLRDASVQQVTAYALLGGKCPVATDTQLYVAGSVPLGSTTQLCAQVVLRGRRIPLPGLPVHFTLANHAVGTATTDESGVACTPAGAGGVAQRLVATADFPGDLSYLPSGDSGSILVVGPTVITAVAPPPLAGGIVVGPAQPPPPPNPLSAPAPAPAHGLAQAQAQAPQSQTQAQNQAQSVTQPAMVAQRQHQVQVAAALQAVAPHQQSQGSYAMTALGAEEQSEVSPVLIGGMGAVMALFAVGLSWTFRPQRSLAAAVARRRRTGPPSRRTR